VIAWGAIWLSRPAQATIVIGTGGTLNRAHLSHQVFAGGRRLRSVSGQCLQRAAAPLAFPGPKAWRCPIQRRSTFTSRFSPAKSSTPMASNSRQTWKPGSGGTRTPDASARTRKARRSTKLRPTCSQHGAPGEPPPRGHQVAPQRGTAPYPRVLIGCAEPLLLSPVLRLRIRPLRFC